MTKRAAFLLLTLVPLFGLYAVIRLAVNLPAVKRGNDAMDYVSLHGNIQYESTSAESVRPIDVTGVYIVEGSANQTMIRMLGYLPNLRHITIGPDYRQVPIGASAEDLPELTDAATVDLKRLQAAFPNLDVRVAAPIQDRIVVPAGVSARLNQSKFRRT